MGIEWDITGIKDYERLCTFVQDLDKPEDRQQWNPVTEALIDSAMSCGYDHIGEDNLEIVQHRLAVLQLIEGGSISMTYKDPRTGRDITTKVTINDSDIERHIGLRVWGRHINVTTDRKFNAAVVRYINEAASTDRMIQKHNARENWYYADQGVKLPLDAQAITEFMFIQRDDGTDYIL